MKETQDLLRQQSAALGNGSPSTTNHDDAKDEDWEFVPDIASVHSFGSGASSFPSPSAYGVGDLVVTVQLPSSYRDVVLRPGSTRADVVLPVVRRATNKELLNIQDTPPRSKKSLPAEGRLRFQSSKDEQVDDYLFSSMNKNPSSKRRSSSGHTMRRHVSFPCSRGQTRDYLSSSKKVMDKDHCDLHKTWGCKGQEGSRTGRQWFLKKQRRHESHANRQKRKEALREEAKQLD